MRLTQTQLIKCIGELYPNVIQEVSDKLQAIECTNDLVSTIYSKVIGLGYDQWEVRLITLTTVLRLCYPETLFTRSAVRRLVCKVIAKEFGVTTSAVSRNVENAKYYYAKIEWVKNEVDKLVKEVNDGEVNG